MKGRIESHLPAKVERVGGEPTPEDVSIVSKKFFSKMLTYPDIRFREFFDPRYLKKHGLTDRDIAFEAVSGGGIHNIVVADDNRTAICILELYPFTARVHGFDDLEQAGARTRACR